MKIAISGKGGVGKTTLCALLAKAATRHGYRVLAVDADPNPTLAETLGYTQEITPLTSLPDLMEERLGSLEGFLRLNPQVDDIPERFALQKDGIKLLVMGTIRQGGSGCACPHNTLLKSLLAHIVLERNELVLLDLEAGLEPLGRATAQGVDAMLIVVEPDQVSFSTAGRIHKLAQDIGIKNLLAVANKVRGSADLAYIQQHLPSPLTLLGSVPYSDALRRSGGDKIEDEAVLPGIQEILKGLKTSLSVSVNKL